MVEDNKGKTNQKVDTHRYRVDRVGDLEGKAGKVLLGSFGSVMYLGTPEYSLLDDNGREIVYNTDHHFLVRESDSKIAYNAVSADNITFINGLVGFANPRLLFPCEKGHPLYAMYDAHLKSREL